MSEKIILIDGHSILNRAFYGVPLLTNTSGVHTNAVYGFLNIMFRILDEEDPQYLAVAFDMSAPTFRHKQYGAYKGTRHPMPDELREQVPMMQQMLRDMRVPLMMLEGYEADDLIGTVSRQAEENGLDVCVISGDRDLLQLASDRTQILIPKTKKGGTETESYFAEDVKAKYLVTPEEFIQVKALMGDASDNIPGIPGVGEKTATKIIAEYHTIDNAHDHADEIRPPRAAAALRDYWDDAKLSEWLARIDRHAPFELDFDAAKLDRDHAAIYTQEALEMCRKLELRTMVSRLLGKTQEQQPGGGEDTEDDQEDGFSMIDCRTGSGLREADEYLSGAISGRKIGIQIISDGPDLIGAAVASGDRTAFLYKIPREKLVKLVSGAEFVNAIDLKEQLPFLDDGHEFPQETQGKYFDAAIGSYLLNPLQGSYPYDMISQAYAGKTVRSRLEILGKMTDAQAAARGFESLDENEGSDALHARRSLTDYACLAARAALESEDAIRDGLHAEGMTDLFEKIEMPLVFVLYHMQKEGVRVRADELRSFGEKLTGRIADLENEIYRQAGQEFNINSPKQLGQILFEELGLPHGKKTKTGYSTAAGVLEKLAEEYPIVDNILEYRQLTKLKSTYAEGLSEYISDDGRIHGKFNQTITATGRISSTDPNLQNIPVRTELGRELRKVFVPKDGSVFVDADYSQIELRVLAHVSGDENLIKAYNSAEDIHAITASEVFHVPLDQVTPQLRRNAKAVNFGIVYGISSFGLSQGLSITRKEAADFIEQYFRTFPGVKRFLDGAVNDARKKGYSVTLFGRRRPIPELKESNFARRSFGERVAMNAPIQGTAADIIKIAMNGVDRRLRSEGLKSRLVLQIHDELLIETAADEKEKVEKILREEMEGAVSLRVRLEVDMKSGDSWYDAH